MQRPELPLKLCAYPTPCVQGIFTARLKRFFVEALVDGCPVVAHTNNTGSMLGLLRPGCPVLLSPSQNPARKTAWTLEAMGLNSGLDSGLNLAWAGVNTSLPNKLLPLAWQAGLLDWACGYTRFQAEQKQGQSRLDGLLTGPNLPDLWVECKNVSLVEDEVAAFPDAVSERGLKHLHELQAVRATGCRAAMLYVVQRPDACCFAPADYIDQAYADALIKAAKSGVEIRVVQIGIQPDGVYFLGNLPLSKNFSQQLAT